ncbi:MAG: hypothetical protein R3263_05760, partial [Myxococcota bacterium]|nr:hypothetical protein [Myxococcota bacterium]
MRGASRRLARRATARGAAPRVAIHLIAAWVDGPGPARAAELGVVHVEGNVGGASGGHVALRVDGRAWHLRVGPDGLLRLERAEWEDFVFH